MKSLIEIYNLVLESKKTEQQAQDILLKSKFSEEEIFKIINELKKIDTSENQKYLPMMATVFSWNTKLYFSIIRNNRSSWSNFTSKPSRIY
jgi:hypothetical protein